MNGIMMRKRIGMIMMVLGWIVTLLSEYILNILNIFWDEEDNIGIIFILVAVCICLLQPIGLLIMGKGPDGSPGMLSRLISFVMRIAGVFSTIAVIIPIFPINLILALMCGLTGAVICMVIAVVGGTFGAIILGTFDYIRTFFYLRSHKY